jgi:uncharacterized DUF497 family protein
MSESNFEWDETKDLENQRKHGVSFTEAQFAFFDESRVIAEDLAHSENEQRFYCLGLNKDKSGILTVRFTYRAECISIFGAGYWRKGKKVYEQNNSI